MNSLVKRIFLLITANYISKHLIKIVINIKFKIRQKKRNKRRREELNKQLGIMVEDMIKEFRENGFSDKEAKIAQRVFRFSEIHNL